MRILKTPLEVRQWSLDAQRRGQRIALVPTMGFLHDGHLTLMREGLRRADVVAATLFVNPMQFGPTEDLSRYPRDFEGDCAKCESVGVQVLYAPEPSVMYPHGFQTSVKVAQVSQGLCGDRRPGHFEGVATVVTKLLALFRPNVALFGEKDWQQLQVIKTLTRDLELGVEIIGVPTVREASGLAMSSRNSYLSAEEKKTALALVTGLRAAQQAATNGEADVERLRQLIRAPLVSAQVKEDYVEIRHATELTPLTTLSTSTPARALVAAFVGKARLIDNVELSLGGGSVT